jgi:methionyl-tRNA formyltransferase
MKIFITLYEEPVYINPFVKKIIESLPDEITGIGIQQGKTIVVGKGISDKIKYLITMAVISDPWNLIRRAVLYTSFVFLEKIKFLGFKNPYSIAAVAEKYRIPIIYCHNVNSPDFIEMLKQKNVDVIINQAQAILSKDFLQIPRVGCINRHAALLPKYRGRLAPFWAYLHGEAESGLSIHFIDEKIDNGEIIVQKRVPIKRFDTVDTLLDRIFLDVAPGAMLEALESIRSGEYQNILMKNDALQATYYSAPKLKHALLYRLVMFRRMFLGK